MEKLHGLFAIFTYRCTSELFIALLFVWCIKINASRYIITQKALPNFHFSLKCQEAWDNAALVQMQNLISCFSTSESEWHMSAYYSLGVEEKSSSTVNNAYKYKIYYKLLPWKLLIAYGNLLIHQVDF